MRIVQGFSAYAGNNTHNNYTVHIRKATALSLEDYSKDAKTFNSAAAHRLRLSRSPTTLWFCPLYSIVML